MLSESYNPWSPRRKIPVTQRVCIYWPQDGTSSFALAWPNSSLWTWMEALFHKFQTPLHVIEMICQHELKHTVFNVCCIRRITDLIITAINSRRCFSVCCGSHFLLCQLCCSLSAIMLEGSDDCCCRHEATAGGRCQCTQRKRLNESCNVSVMVYPCARPPCRVHTPIKR